MISDPFPVPEIVLIVTHIVMCYFWNRMINSFQHKGLRLFFENNDPSKLQPHHIEKIRRIPYRLDEARSIEEFDVIGWGLHQLKGRPGRILVNVKVNGNYQRLYFSLKTGTLLMLTILTIINIYDTKRNDAPTSWSMIRDVIQGIKDETGKDLTIRQSSGRVGNSCQNAF
jgi:proteic killer suppression protein